MTYAIFSLYTDAQLTIAIRSAWIEAARCWQEARNTTPREQMLFESAKSAEHFWQALVDEAIRRGKPLDPTIDPSLSTYQYGDALQRLYLSRSE